MLRDMVTFQESLKRHETWQHDYFTVIRNKKYERANEWREKGEIEKANALKLEADRMRFVFDKSTCRINYGQCSLLNKPISFIPNTCQLDTQHCFEHRRG